MSPTIEVEVRRNRHGSVLAYANRDRAARLLDDHRAVLQSLYDLVDRRHGSDGEIVARLSIREDARVVDELDLCDRFRRDLNADRAISLVEDLRYHAGEHELVTDGGEKVDGETDRTVYFVDDPTELGSDCSNPAGHRWEPYSTGDDRDTDPMTASHMECLNCGERRDVQDGDLYGYAGAYQPPEGVSVRDE